MADTTAIYNEASTLKPTERLRLVEMLLADLDQPDGRIDQLWATEAQSRLDAHQRGELSAISHQEVVSRYRK